ncbi:MAG TPA: TlpA disulfide reductase family protein, partial [Povalibacter sp.]|uniref:TlpA disulfide reductase family protein n=1 Tax=Povalibacter sp. TaxID=1962978 RepID=UPI002C9D5C2C
MILLRSFLLSLALLCIGACSSQVGTPTIGHYRATLELPGGPAPFGLDVAREGDEVVLYLINGRERTRVPNVTLRDGELAAMFPGYENSLRATMHRDRLEGAVTLIKAGGVEQVIPFKATLGETGRFYAESSTDNADVAGRWEVTFTDDAGKTSRGVAIFEQTHDRVTGTVMTPTGDHRFLEGQVHGDDVHLSTFAGGLAYLYKLRIENGALVGEYWQGLKGHEKVSAQRNEDAELEHIATTLKSDRFDFTFEDVDGKPVSLSDERFRGKVVLVTLGGTWCPNCHDEAAVLVPFYQEHKDRGFEIIALMFERHGEFARAAAAVRGYQRDLHIDYPTLIAGVADDEDPERKLPTLSGVYGYPTSILIDRQGKIRNVHTGFNGPATGQHYDEYVQEFTQQVNELLAET